MFRNYWVSPGESLYNESVVRTLLAIYLIWKVAFLPVYRIASYPKLAPQYELYSPPIVYDYFAVLQVIAIVFAIAFALAPQFRLSSIGLGVAVTYIGIVTRPVTQMGHFQSLFFAALLVFLYGIYHQKEANQGRSTSPLGWFLLITAITYFGGAFVKMVLVGPVWVLGKYLGGAIIFTHVNIVYHSPIAEYLLQNPTLLTISASAVIILHLTFLPGVLTDTAFSVFMLGLIGMHIAIAVILGPFFYDQIIFLAFYLDWERVLPDLDWGRGPDGPRLGRVLPNLNSDV
jgi:hypothetical protein